MTESEPAFKPPEADEAAAEREEGMMTQIIDPVADCHRRPICPQFASLSYERRQLKSSTKVESLSVKAEIQIS
jgi:hypothetical protein